MLFQSIQFVLFFIAVYTLYLTLNHKWQNRLLLIASYVFYAFWDWRFLSLIFVSTTIDYFCGIKIYETENVKRKKIFLLFSIVGNLSILGFFKYFNFFIYNLQVLLEFIGIPSKPLVLNIILPIGISFYTFKTMTYTISIYWKQMKPTKNFLDYALYPAFFPALLAGPIDRANSFLPQIISPRKITLEKFYEGCYLIFWGLFQKLFIADNLSKFIVDPVFSNGLPYDGAKVLIALYGFVIQLYCDFAGYSNIAIGLGKLMGFEMMTNFNLPLFAVNVQDFWNRWHISLSTWVRDYVYIPFFLHYRNMKEKIRLSLAVMITMIIIGLWHGATWNFVVFGIWEGFILIIYQFIRTPIGNLVKPQSSFGRDIWLFVRIIFMFNITAISFSIFRAQSVPQIYDLVYSLLFNFKLSAITSEYLLQMVFFVFILVFIEIIQFRKNNQKNVLGWKTLSRTAFYFICYYLIIIFGFEGGKEFFYFQF